MIQVKKDNVAYFDVDDTLIVYKFPIHRENEALDIGIEGSLLQAHVVPHHRHIEMLKLHYTWGNGVIVWSRSGYEWAATVVAALGLTDYVDACMAKPFYHYDDKSCCEILGEHRYQAEEN